MAALKYSVCVAPSKPVVSNDVPPGEDRRRWSPTASTLIYGSRDAVLVDALMTQNESRALADWVAATGKNVTAIFITHAHGDHFFGAPAVLERFPAARVVAAPVSRLAWRPNTVNGGSTGSGTRDFLARSPTDT